ncbi:hypothetical protein TGAM01_v204025 [Trichoderma gamsii]|uniref:Uncharacterized protein n=1 Tax=Trichoderma gamsii TaxID=398673 RepID=A0A2P4ZS24_9HYPO|nr:hypothetical protein TGAM01_v204025 [Trichoderma gamsii]PON27076.1 hypothetical protein TGAM01_v204025 [Trichoderma gamsii]
MERSSTSVWGFFRPQTLLSLLESPFFSLLDSPSSTSPYASKMANPDTGVFGAIGAVLGYVGAEVATGQIFERLLWPQRSYANVTLKSIPIMAILMPMGGPLHIIALKTLDVMSSHGLFKGARVGHMLGTAFYPDQDWTYTSWTSNGQKIKTESVRNCLWVRALSYIPIPKLGCDTQQATDQTHGKPVLRSDQVRAKVAVSHLTLTRATKQDTESKIPFVDADVGRPAFQVFLAIFITESSAILTAVGVAVYFKSLWALWWLTPLLLRLVSAVFSVDRKPLEPLDLTSPNEDFCDYEIHCPQSEGNFMLLTGPKSVVQQFFVHYGHPVRNRFREAVQLAMVALFGLLFLFGLFFSVIWMPIAVQKVWVCYHFYSGFAMIVMRYTSNGTSTEAIIAKHFRKQEKNVVTVDSEKKETAILFGHSRDGNETIKVSFVPTYRNRFLEGQACMDKLLRRKS